MKSRLLTLCFAIMSLVLISCEKENVNDIDPSQVAFEVATEKLGKSSQHYGYYEILCSGSLGGFTGEATVRVKGYGSKKVNVTGAKTPYSFIFLRDISSWGTNRPTYTIEVIVDDKVVMSTSVVER